MAAPDNAQIFYPGGKHGTLTRSWIAEVPIALEFNGISYAVMMATPQDLEDFIIGFALTEGLVHARGQIDDIAIAETDNGWIVRTALTGPGADLLKERARARVSESSCGLCGIENLEAIAKPLPHVAPHDRLDPHAIFAALGELRGRQQLGLQTGAAHAAAWANTHGQIGWVREDVGRHNAMDKLIGAMAREACGLSPGFILSTARCSFEIVEKSVRAGAATLATISLPTSMAVERAQSCGLSLWVLARDDSALLVNDGSL